MLGVRCRQKKSPETVEVPGDSEAPPPCGEESSLPSGVEEVHGSGKGQGDRHGRALARDQVFQLSALSSSDERWVQLFG